MAAVFGVILGILAVICAFGFIIFIHEMGHFLTARAVDIRCPQFAIGFGKSLFGFRWRGTNFAVRAFPFGGYVLMNGEEPGDSNRSEDPWAAAVSRYLGEAEFPAEPETLLQRLREIPESERCEAWQDVHDQVAYARTKEFPNLRSVEGNFHDRSIKARILVISGGVIMNFLATILLLWSMGPLVGLGSFFREWTPVISQAVEGAPAARNGVTAGSLLVKVDEIEVGTDLEAFHAIGAHRGENFNLVFRAPGEEEDKQVDIRPWLVVGYESYEVNDDGGLILKRSAKQPDLVDKAVVETTREELLEQTESLQGEEKATYQLRLAGMDEATTFELPKKYKGARGIIGVMFGVGDIRFEDKLSGRVATVEPGSPAETAGFLAGDELIRIDSLVMASRFQTYGSLADKALASVSSIEQIDEYEILVQRGSDYEVLTVPKDGETASIESLGLSLEPIKGSELVAAPFNLIAAMMAQPIDLVKLWMSEEYTGTEIVQNLQGPIGIMQLLYNFSDNGFFQFLFFVAVLNAAIGAFNLLPFPALDGSRLVFLALEGIRGKAVDPEKEAKIHLAGLMILLSFVVIVTFGDIRRLVSADIFVL